MFDLRNVLFNKLDFNQTCGLASKRFDKELFCYNQKNTFAKCIVTTSFDVCFYICFSFHHSHEYFIYIFLIFTYFKLWYTGHKIALSIIMSHWYFDAVYVHKCYLITCLLDGSLRKYWDHYNGHIYFYQFGHTFLICSIS